ncbi:hypothetical protein M514_20862 [Trichuris suis]|uniref:Uncharacterized protein n=1 Tax=Trichuris suis TaxID=68888 RepID=A0A085NC00_9BILA|nr:hypothetical protein M513_07186 [Trichuris suis]KFD51859.1 hypothetical protein M513_07188 [Trichuris suis]KFD66996.1 hypothetical protein M514_20862 [Trichuris suis]
MGRGQSRSFSNINTEEDKVAEILDTLKHLSTSDECNETDIDMWLACDNKDAAFHVLNDDEILATVSDLYGGSDKKKEEFYDDEMLENVCPSHEEAYQCLEVALQWFKMQECDLKRMLCLKSIRDLAANKRTTALKQTSVTVFFK